MTLPGIMDWGLGIRAALGIALTITALAPASVSAQPADPTLRPRSKPATPAPVAANEAAVAPIECWWKTDRNAVRVGERFLLTLTCAVLDTERVKVVVDESSLEPAALHLTPFEVVSGQRFRDIPNAPRRFFQYQYSVRALGEELFGKEVPLPRLQISYRVQNSLQGGAALQGREAQYSLVPVPIRVLSLVPPGASDIRDTPADTFGDVEARLFRSNLLLIGAAVAFVLAALMAALMIARTAMKRHAGAAVRRTVVSPAAAVGAASRELGAVRTAAQVEGWTPDLAGRAASALRLAGAVALSKPIGQKEVDRSAPVGEGQIVAPPGLRTLRGKKVLLSAAITPDSVRTDGAPPQWRPISEALAAFSAARYSRDGALDGVALDSTLANAQDAVKRLRVSQMMKLGRRRRGVEATAVRTTWAR